MLGAILLLGYLAIAFYRFLLSDKLRKARAALRKSDPRAFTALEYVYVEADGTARELEPFEIDALIDGYHGSDGNRPYLKIKYSSRTPARRLSGFLRRKKLPRRVRVKSALEGTIPIQSAEDAIAIAKVQIASWSNYVVVDVNSLGTFSAKLVDGIWHVMRIRPPSELQTPPPAVGWLPLGVEISAASGRLIKWRL